MDLFSLASEHKTHFFIERKVKRAPTDLDLTQKPLAPPVTTVICASSCGLSRQRNFSLAFFNQNSFTKKLNTFVQLKEMDKNNNNKTNTKLMSLLFSQYFSKTVLQADDNIK